MKKLFTFFIVVLLSVTVALANKPYKKVTDLSQIEVGKKYVFAHAYSDYVSVPTTSLTSAAKYAKLDKSGGDGTGNIINLDVIAPTATFLELTLGGSTDEWTFMLPDNVYYLSVSSSPTTTSLSKIKTINNYSKWRLTQTDDGIILANGGYQQGTTTFPNRVVRQQAYNKKFECCDVANSTYDNYGYGFLYVKLDEVVLGASVETLDLGTTGSGSFTVSGANLYQDVTVSIDAANSDAGFSILSPASIAMDEVNGAEVTVGYHGLVDGAEAYVVIKSDDVEKRVKVTANAVPKPSGITIYIDKESVGNFYTWNTDEVTNGSWPGMAINSLSETMTMSGKECYVYTYDGTAAGLIFSDGNSQTGNIVPEDGKVYKYLGGDICTMLYQFAITKDNNLNPDHSESTQKIYVYTWDENTADSQDVNKQLGEFPGKRVYDLPDNIKAGKLKVVNVDVRVSTNLGTYKPYIIFNHGVGKPQTDNIPMQADKAYRYINNEATIVEGLPIISSIFPDDAFRFGLNDITDVSVKQGSSIIVEKNGVLTEEELGTKLNLAAGTSIPDAGPAVLARCVSNGFKVLNNLKGIEHFTNLTTFNLVPPTGLTCNIRELDLTICPNLENVSITNSPNLELFRLPESTIKRIKLSGCNSLPRKLDTSTYANLTYLYVGSCTGIKDIEISQNTVLDSLYISNVQIPDLDLANNTELKYLSLSSTKISSLDLSTLAKLGYLYVGSNSLLADASIDVTNNPELYYIQIYAQNAFTTLDLTNNLKLEEVAVISCSKLTQPTLNPDLETLKVLHITSCPKISGCTFDLAKNVNLEQLIIGTTSNSQGSDTSSPGSSSQSLNNVIKGVGPHMTNLRYICTEGQSYYGNELDLTGCEHLHNLDVLNCKLDKLSVAGCKLLGNIDNAVGDIPKNTNTQFFIFGNYLRSLDLQGVDLAYNYNLSTGTKAPFKDSEYIRHYSYNGQVAPKITPNVALAYINHDTRKYTYLVYVRLNENADDINPLTEKAVPTLNGLFRQAALDRLTNSSSDVEDAADPGFDYSRVKLWSRFEQENSEKVVSNNGGVIQVVHGTRSANGANGAPPRLEGFTSPTDIDPGTVYGDVLSLGLYEVSMDEEEPQTVSGKVSYMYVTDPTRNSSAMDDEYNGDAISDAKQYYTGLTLQNNAAVEGYDNVFPFEFEWEIELTNEPESIVTGIEQVRELAPIADVTYYNVMGVASSQPFDGVNIVVTRYNDGTVTTTKVIR